MAESLRRDLAYAFRLFRKHPGFTGIAVLTLALGIGANTTIFSVINTVLFNPLPYYRNADRLVILWMASPSKGWTSVPASLPDFRDWKEQSQLFDGIALSITGQTNLTGGGEPEQLQMQAVSANLFDVLGVDAVVGRTFLPEEEQWGKHRVIVLSYGLWQRQFGGDPGIVGQPVQLDGTPYTVVGVAPRTFRFPAATSQVQLWRPYALSPDSKPQRFNRMLTPVVARLKPGVMIEQADQEMKAIARRLEQQYQETNAGYTINVFSMGSDTTQSVRPALLLLLGAVGFVLLIACANVASLLLARATGRKKEIAIRSTLGASRGRVLRQLLTESVLLSLLGGVAGVLLAAIGLRLIVAIGPNQSVPRLDQARLDGLALGFTLGISVLTSILFGLVPALQLSKADLQESLKEGGRKMSGGHRSRRIFQVLVVSEIMLASMLLIGAGLLIKSFSRLQSIDPGFNTKNMLTMRLRLPIRKYNGKVTQFFQELIPRIEALPEVQSAAAGSFEDALPMLASGTTRIFEIGDRALPTDMAEKPLIGFRPVTPGFIKTLGIPLVRGRFLAEQDKQDTPPVAVINNALAEKYFANEDPIDRKITVDGVSLTVVGVVGDVKFTGLDMPVIPDVYTSYYQDIYTTANIWLAVRTSSDPIRLATAVQEQVRAIDKDLAPSRIVTMDQIVMESISEKQFSMVLLGILGTVALVLAAVGIYGVMAHSVSERTHEIGLRVALGAQRSDIYKLVVGNALVLMLIGVVLGLIGAFVLRRAMAAVLYGVSATDPLIFIATVVILCSVALLACLIPARRAVRVDPITALRYE